MLQLGLRLGDRPRVLVPTPPRPGPDLRRIMASPRTIVTGGPTFANPHLPDAYLEAVTGLYAGTRLGRQELEGLLIEDIEGALWTRDTLEAARVRLKPPLPRGEGERRQRSMSSTLQRAPAASVRSSPSSSWRPKRVPASRPVTASR